MNGGDILGLLGIMIGSQGLWTFIDHRLDAKGGVKAQLITMDQKNDKQFAAVNGRLDKHEAEQKEKDIRDARNRILRFADECRRGVRHSEEFFIQILDDIREYEEYCETHHEFKNSRTVESIRVIRDAYDHCVKTGDFLVA